MGRWQWIEDEKPVLVVYFDGSCQPNPGMMRIGYFIEDVTNSDPNQPRVLVRHAETLGIGTNNVAEYKACLYALENALRFEPGAISVLGDSELVIKQLNGTYDTNDETLKMIHSAILSLKESVDTARGITFQHIPREMNLAADMMSKMTDK